MTKRVIKKIICCFARVAHEISVVFQTDEIDMLLEETCFTTYPAINSITLSLNFEF